MAREGFGDLVGREEIQERNADVDFGGLATT